MICFPVQAYANAGTPLMWAGLLHLVLGNALIGVGEGFLLARMFSISKAKSIGIMIPANYFSAWAGGFLICGLLVDKIPMDLNNGWRWFWAMVLVAYLMTIVFEWPFIAWCFRGSLGVWKRSFRASVVVQTASYALLFGWYWLASGTSLYTRMNIVSPEDLALPDSVLVYFISPKDGDVWKRPLHSGPGQKVYRLNSSNKNDRLFIRPNCSVTNHWDLVARIDAEQRSDVQLLDLLTNLTVEAAPDWRVVHSELPYEGTWFSFGRVQALGSATNSEWNCWAGFWPVEGLRAENKIKGKMMRISYETPFGAWTVRNAVLLPTDKVLFQLGHDQICAFAPEHRQVALLWHGKGPVAVIPKAQ
jgi:hypothetical protein